LSDTATENGTKKTGDKKYLVGLWLNADTDPSDYNWSEVIPADSTLEGTDVQEFDEVSHIAVVYITRPLNINEWIELGDKQDEAIFNVVGDGNAFVMAGPLPVD